MKRGHLVPLPPVHFLENLTGLNSDFWKSSKSAKNVQFFDFNIISWDKGTPCVPRSENDRWIRILMLASLISAFKGCSSMMNEFVYITFWWNICIVFGVLGFFFLQWRPTIKSTQPLKSQKIQNSGQISANQNERFWWITSIMWMRVFGAEKYGNQHHLFSEWVSNWEKSQISAKYRDRNQ